DAPAFRSPNLKLSVGFQTSRRMIASPISGPAVDRSCVPEKRNNRRSRALLAVSFRARPGPRRRIGKMWKLMVVAAALSLGTASTAALAQQEKKAQTAQQ